ncbi:sensor histidine kinase [Micromonospora sp. HM5-17]|uniref:sensor histidine kinase n=1 Tax=Micromonospora sp. HM5-17 TaxID=2487710 RepID=UPI000F4A85CF|nr:sensor histidine kinase [Micromonospora sp. HM5-17]ROT26792.1 sensor histidine kinase [Micromonospora sp. HM5-17]
MTAGALEFDVAALVGLSFVLAGLVGWRARPRNRVGPLLLAVGVLWVLAALPVPVSLPRGVAMVRAGAWAAVFVHLVVAYPTGRLDTAPARLVVALGYVSLGVVGVLTTLRPDTAGAGGGAGAAAVTGVVVTGCAVIAQQSIRWVRGTPSRRRQLNPLLGVAVVTVALVVAVKPATIAGRDASGLNVVLQVALAAVPLAYLVGLLRRRIDRAGVADLVVRLHRSSQPVRVEVALARTLHDPTLRIGYWAAGSGRYVDADGQPITPGPDRAVTRIDADGEPVAILDHDRALLEEPELIEATCAALSLALERERLTAELRSRLRELAASRRNLVRAAEAERRRLERDLHDGVQQRLLSIPMTLSLAEAVLPEDPDRVRPLLEEARKAILAVLADLRALTQGLHPPVLTERGLAGAVRELATLSPVPLRILGDVPSGLPAEVETTAYYVVAEALANIAKHAAADEAELRIDSRGGRLTVEVRDDGRGGADPASGSGLRGLAERVAVEGGVFQVESPPGRGTRIRATLPCG